MLRRVILITSLGIAASGLAADTPPPFADEAAQRYHLTKRASEIDPRAREYAAIDFTFKDKAGKVQDLQHAVVDTRGGHLERACTGDDAAERPMAVADDLPMPLRIHQILVPFQEQLDLDMQGLLEQRLRSTTHHLIQRHQRQTSVWTSSP